MAFWSFTNIFKGGGVKKASGIQSLQPSSGRLTNRIVSDETALQISTVFAAVRLLAETVSGLPLKFYKKKGNIKELYDGHPLGRLFSSKPNRHQTRIEFFETIMFNLAFRGNAFCHIERNAVGDIISLMPMVTSQVDVMLDADTNIITYRYSIDGKTIILKESQVWHLKLFGNGVMGLSPFDYARNSFGIAISAEERVSTLANTGFKPSGVLTIDKVLSPEQRKAVRENFQDLANSGNDVLRVLEAGMQYTQISMNPKDVQLFENRRFSTEEIARFFGVPSVLINDHSASTVWGSGISEIIRGFFKLGIKPYLSRIEESIKCNLLTIIDRIDIDVKFDFDELLRGSEKERAEGYNVAIRSGVRTPNECREEEGLSPDPAGDKLFIDRQLVFLENGGQPDAKATDKNNRL